MAIKSGEKRFLYCPRDLYKRYLVMPSFGIWLVQITDYRSPTSKMKTKYYKHIPRWMRDGMAILDLAKENRKSSFIPNFGRAYDGTYVFYEQLNGLEATDSKT